MWRIHTFKMIQKTKMQRMNKPIQNEKKNIKSGCLVLYSFRESKFKMENVKLEKTFIFIKVKSTEKLSGMFNRRSSMCCFS